MVRAERFLAPFVQMKSALKTSGPPGFAEDGVMHATRTPRHRTPLVAPPELLSIPCPDPTGEDRERDIWQTRGQTLARQEDWGALVQQIAEADTARTKTPGGMPVAELLAFGARADVVGAAEHALITGRPERGARLLEGIEALERVLADMPEDPILASIVAQTHMDLGWAWRGTGWAIEVPEANRAAYDAHFDRAADIMATFCPRETDSPLLGGTMCALASGQTAQVQKLVQKYETWMDLDPRNPRAFRAMGTHLLPRWHGSYDRLELEARRAAGRTFDIWGSGAYAWVMFDAISTDTEACARLDLEFFIDGLRDILRYSRDQHTVNLIAAYCANTMGATATGHDEADYIRAQIADEGRWVVHNNLTELHPMLWAHAARGFDNALRVRCANRFAASGHNDALRYLTDLFRRELASGQRVVFTKNGPETHPV